MGAPVRVAAIDCGTNSIRLLVTDVDGNTKHDLVREMRIVRLGQDVDATGRLADEAIERTLAAAREYANIIETLDVSRVRFGATSAVRDAANSEDFGDVIEGVLGVRPLVLTGEEEAAASFDGATRAFGAGRSAVIDLGGGSTEVVIGAASVVEWAHSFDVGSVRLTERFLHSDPPSMAEISACQEHLDAVVVPTLSGLAAVETLVGVAGTITTVAAHTLRLDSYSSEAIHAACLAIDEVRSACLSLVRMPLADRRALPYMHPGRADVIAAGALILDRLLEYVPADTEQILVSESDILDGIAWRAALG
jgi:exopolyphosphatase/guanosine-5'-triphosphate,3'-diphosphate pyrophosphatase